MRRKRLFWGINLKVDKVIGWKLYAPQNGLKRGKSDMGILNDLLARVQTVNDGLQDGFMIRDVVSRHSEDIMAQTVLSTATTLSSVV